jgi:hypothetical protein
VKENGITDGNGKGKGTRKRKGMEWRQGWGRGREMVKWKV